ncbi:unnamed protein product, partial [Schistosoma turkestanicum]
IIGVALLTKRDDWYEPIIATIVPFTVLILGVVLGERMKYSAGKLRIVLFLVCCALLVIGIICSILSIICRNKNECKIVWPILSAICWCEAMFVIIAFTTYFLMKQIKLEDYSKLYVIFIHSLEYILFVIIS